jgi:CRP/FNR family transcriptional regulator
LAVCGALDNKSLSELQRQVQHVRFAPGQTIAIEHGRADAAFIVLSGVVSLYKGMPDGRRQIVGFLFPGDFIGFTCDDGRYCQSAEAVTPAELCRLPASTLARLAREHPQIEQRLMGALSAELCAAQEQMLWLGRQSALEKLASFLLMLAERREGRGGRANDVRLPMSRQEIADCLGLTEATVSRALTRLAKRGLIWVPRPHEVVILRRELLEAVAEGAAEPAPCSPAAPSRSRRRGSG